MTFRLTFAGATATKNGCRNRLSPADRPAHDWYRFVLSFPPHLVREYLERFEVRRGHTVLDPFCGTGTTLVECKKLGIRSIGIEAHPMAHFASEVKTDWQVNPDRLLQNAELVAAAARRRIAYLGVCSADSPGLRTLPAEESEILLRDSISPLPLHKSLVLLDSLFEIGDRGCRRHELLALAATLVFDVSNLHFGPEVGVRGHKDNAAVVSNWMRRVRRMAQDLRLLRGKRRASSRAHLADSRQVQQAVAPQAVDAVITSPPYPNEKDYTRTTRLESVVLGFIRDREGLRHLKQGLLRSNTRNVYKQDQDDRWVDHFPQVQRLAEAIENRRVQLGKTSGFERLYHRVARLYFGGMARHLAELRTVLRPGARLAYVVGDQASYLRVMIRTGELLGQIAQSLGYEVLGRDLFRTRLATATREQLREEVLLLHWAGRAV